MQKEEFIRLVERAVEALPEEFLDRLENVIIDVADEPTAEQLDNSDEEDGTELLGLYEGVPLTERRNSPFMMPDRITIFQKAIEASFHTREEIVTEIQNVVRHEIAHYFGIDDDRLEELGL